MKAKTKRGFTLIELMVVVTVIVILLSIAFKLLNIGSEEEKKSNTIKRLQRMKNALSGYYAAYGGYPPVKLHGDRNIYLKVTKWGIQRRSSDSQMEKRLVWDSVNAACRSQPVAVEFPFADAKWVERVAEVLKMRATSGKKTDKAFAANNLLATGFNGLTRPSGQLGNYKDSTDWRDVQVFKFGVLSYLLPRYLFMTTGDADASGLAEVYTINQWNTNNEVQKQCYGDGREIYKWADICDDAKKAAKVGKYKGVSERERLKAERRILTIPSQAICARWMPNLEGVVVNGREFFGIDTAYHDGAGHKIVYLTSDVANPQIYCPTENSSQQYVLDKMSVRDGWGHDLYYYSPPPYQNCDLWSAGANGKTFPPWVEPTSLNNKADVEKAKSWMADDIR